MLHKALLSLLGWFMAVFSIPLFMLKVTNEIVRTNTPFWDIVLPNLGFSILWILVGVMLLGKFSETYNKEVK